MSLAEEQAVANLIRKMTDQILALRKALEEIEDDCWEGEDAEAIILGTREKCAKALGRARPSRSGADRG